VDFGGERNFRLNDKQEELKYFHRLFTLLTQSPVYFRTIHGWSVEMTGLLSGVPHFLRTAFSMGFSYFGDHLLTHNKMSRTNVRKLATFFRKLLKKFSFII
jgi:hypothetical protein